MNIKLQKFYSALFSFSKKDYLNNPSEIVPFFKYVCDYDFDIASSLWQFMIAEHEKEILEDDELKVMFADRVYEVFRAKSEYKTIRLIHNAAAVRKALFTYSPSACQGVLAGLVPSFLSSSKYATSDDIFKCIYKNPALKYGEVMREIVEEYVGILIKKASEQYKRVDLPKKVRLVLKTHIAKIKGSERALLEQRLRELY